MEQYIYTKLINIYPDHIIEGLARDYPAVYQLVFRDASDKKTTIKEYLSNLGFKYKRVRKPSMSPESVKEQLSNLYPDKVITKLTGIENGLYPVLREIASNEEVSPLELLAKWGFTWKPNKDYTLDKESVTRLVEEFNIKKAELARWLGISRQTLDVRLKSNRTGYDRWTGSVLGDFELDLIKLMIESLQSTFIDEEITIAIRNNGVKPCIFINNDGQIKCFFELPNDLEEILIANNFHVLTDADFEIKRNLEKKVVLGKNLARPIDGKKQIFFNKCVNLGITSDQYMQKLGFDGYLDNRELTDEDIREILKKYVEKDNIIYLPVKSEDYLRLYNKALRAGYTLEEFLDYFGYEKSGRNFQRETLIKLEEYKKELQKYLIGDGNKVYLPSENNELYLKLYGYAYSRGISINSLLWELGFERTYNKKEQLKFDLYNNQRDESENEATIKFLLDELEVIQGNLDKAKVGIEKRNRSQKLSEKLKILYNYRCQLCHPEDGIPLIEKNNGSYYVEVHHIVSIGGSSFSIENEENWIDSYKNVIVVCPFHHKALHYHHGGFTKLERDEEDLFFVSNKESILRVWLNYHL